MPKRKRDAAVVDRETRESPDSSGSDPGGEVDARDIFRQYFEARFEPLPGDEAPPVSNSVEAGSKDDDGISHDESEWDGLSGKEDGAMTVQIVEHQTVSDIHGETVDRSVSRKFMSSRPPRPEDSGSRKQRKADATDDDDGTESLNLKHDLDLQRLLKESHLLEKSKTAANPGSQRHQALDMRMQTLGSKSSLFTQEKMPLAHRRGMAAKASEKEWRRRQDAKDNGVVLERARKERKTTDFKRKDLGIGAPVVGKFRGGTLKLSQRDLADIQGPTAQRGKGRRRGRM